MIKQIARTCGSAQALSLNFLIYTFGGVWRPIGWQSSCAKLLYNSLTCCTIISLYFLMLSQFMDMILVVDNMDDFTANSLMFVTVISVCCKATVAVTRRDAIVNLVDSLSHDPFEPRDEDEMAIRMKFDEFIRSCTIKILLLTVNAVAGYVTGSILSARQGQLPHRVWLPFDYKSPSTFWAISVHQIVTVAIAAVINIGNETIVLGFFLYTCMQLEIFEIRLHKLVLNKATRYSRSFSAASRKRETTISEYVRHHLKIYKYAKAVNNVFNEIFFVQFFGSILVLCTSVYYLSSHVAEYESATMIIYTVGMFVQIFIYCWSGNEVILKSVSVGDVLYHMDWPSLSVGDRRNLLMIMKRSTVPITFTSSFLITFSLESYTSILKMSYTAFNVL